MKAVFPIHPRRTVGGGHFLKKVFILPVRAVRLCTRPCAIWAGGERGAVRVLCGCRAG